MAIPFGYQIWLELYNAACKAHRVFACLSMAELQQISINCGERTVALFMVDLAGDAWPSFMKHPLLMTLLLIMIKSPH